MGQQGRAAGHVIRGGDRVAGQPFASRSAVWGARGAAATAHPTATLIAIDVLRAGGSAVDAAIAANVALGFLEPVACGIGGDAFAMVWDPKTARLVGLNGSGRSPRSLSLEAQRQSALRGHIRPYGATSVSTPGAVDAWWMLHQRFGKLPWRDVFAPAIALANEGAPVPQTIAAHLQASARLFARADLGIEETENFRRIWTPQGRAPEEGEIFANPSLARTLERIAREGRDGFYHGETAAVIDAYFKRIGGWLSAEDLAAHRGEWVAPVPTRYRGVDVWALPPNGQGLATLQMLNILETFDLADAGFQSARAIHLMAEAKRLAFEDRARFYADPDFAGVPVDWLVSKDYAAERARRIHPDRVMTEVHPGQAPGHGDTTYLCAADGEGMMVSLIQSNFRGMGSGLAADGLGFMFQNRGELFDLEEGRPNTYAPGKRPFQTIIPGFATVHGEPWLAYGVMGGDMQPQGQAQIIVNLVDFGLGLQEAGDAPRWRHEGSSDPTGRSADGIGALHLEDGVPEETRKKLAQTGWKIGASDGSFGGYQAVQRHPGRYVAATEMRKDGVALAV